MTRWHPLLLVCFMAGLVGAQGNDRWERLSRRDADGDGKISRDEFPGPDRMFDRMDGDGDGFITEKEIGAMGGGGRRGPRGGMNMTGRFDGDGDGKVTKAEWDAFFKKADENADGILDDAEMRAAMSGRAYNDTAPKVGAAVPKVSAKRAKGGDVVDLAKLRRTTVLVFGSWT